MAKKSLIKATILKGCAGKDDLGTFKYRKGEQVELPAARIKGLGSLVKVETKSASQSRETR